MTALTVTLWEILCLGALLGFSGNQVVAYGHNIQMPLKIFCIAIEVLIPLYVQPITQQSGESFSPSTVILAASSFCVALSCGRAPDNGEREVLIIILSAIDLLLTGATRKGWKRTRFTPDGDCTASASHWK